MLKEPFFASEEKTCKPESVQQALCRNVKWWFSKDGDEVAMVPQSLLMWSSQDKCSLPSSPWGTATGMEVTTWF